MSQSSDRSSWTKRAITSWNDRASDWNSRAAEHSQSPERKADIQRLVRLMSLTRGSKVLDAGCGVGHWSIALAKDGCFVTGVDSSPGMLRYVPENARSAGVNLQVVQADVGHLPFPDFHFDAVVARVVLHFVSNVTQALDEVLRVLRQDGFLYASVPGAISPIYSKSIERFLNPDDQIVNFVQAWELEQLLELRGTRIVDQWGEFGATASGNENEFAEIDLSALPHRLQQAASTTWNFVARKNE